MSFDDYTTVKNLTNCQISWTFFCYLLFYVTLFLLYLVVTGFLKSCKAKQSDNSSGVVEETYEGDYFEDGEDLSDEEVYSSDETLDETINYDEIDQVLEENESTSEEAADVVEEVDYTSSTPVTTTRDGDSTGNFQVISGSYLVKGNAENMVVKLKRMGYNNAEIVIFDLSQYHTVIAARSGNYDSALSIANDLKNRGIDSYVRRKK